MARREGIIRRKAKERKTNVKSATNKLSFFISTFLRGPFRITFSGILFSVLKDLQITIGEDWASDEFSLDYKLYNISSDCKIYKN